MGLNSDWFKDIASSDGYSESSRKTDLANLSDNQTLKLLRDLVKRQVAMAARPTTKTYDRPGWEGYLAHQHGSEQMADYVLSLLSFLED